MNIGSRQSPRVLMLGWEYPPRFAGGLGKACQGLSTAMARKGAQVYFVLPTFPDRIVEERLEVLGAREALIEAGWSEETFIAMSQSAQASGDRAEAGGISWLRSAAVLSPYGEAPEGPMPDSIRRAVGTDRTGSASGPASSSSRGVQSAESDESPEVGIQTIASVPRTEVRRTLKKVVVPTVSTVVKRTLEPAKSSEIYGKNLWQEIERFCFSVRQIAETHEVDCVHAHDWMTFPAAFEFQRVTGAPVFLHVHATEYDRSGENVNNEVFRIEREGFRRATHIFAVSRYTAGIIERLYGIPKKKISVVYNAPDEAAKHLDADPDDTGRDPNVVFLGRLTFQKGVDYFLKAAQLVAQVDETARFVIVGTGDMFDKLRQMTHDLGIEDRVHFTGFLSPSQVDQVLRRSQVLVMPSVSEPFGLVALEAIHNGIPVILSKQSGVREVLHRALQVDFWDHEKLADQMLAALRLPDLHRQLVEDGMDQVQALSWDKSADVVMKGYRKHIGSLMAQAVKGAHGH